MIAIPEIDAFAIAVWLYRAGPSEPPVRQPIAWPGLLEGIPRPGSARGRSFKASEVRPFREKLQHGLEICSDVSRERMGKAHRDSVSDLSCDFNL